MWYVYAHVIRQILFQNVFQIETFEITATFSHWDTGKSKLRWLQLLLISVCVRKNKHRRGY